LNRATALRLNVHTIPKVYGLSKQLKANSRRRAMNINLTTNIDLAGTKVPDSKLAREITELVRDTESPLLFHHSSRVYYWGALAGKRRGLRFDPELLYAGAMFHDMGLTHQHSTTQERFEVDSANTSCEATESINKTLKRSGPRSPCTQRRASPSTCTRS
jgi:HD-GYP domain-containing protein (c-di-GMP phosphodiesterase class II)